ncbi:MAG TPA: DUF58 domain-containing protein [Verrucomicrobiae bacterium]|nr:DUF58 domain-containing protein [Verrucomicrobiae bacterium]
MTIVAFGAILLLLLGVFLAVPVVVILSIVVLVVELVGQVWARFGLKDVTYVRRLDRDRIGWGEEIPVAIEVWNRKRLPLAWLRAEDAASAGVVVRERAVAVGRRGAFVLRNAWTLAPFERVVRHYHVGADGRGVYQLGPVDLSVGDLTAREAAEERRDDTARFLVRPRIVPARSIPRRDRPGGVERATFGLTEDTSRFAGIREYAPGDPVRRIHARSSARLGRPVVKRFEPSRDREVLIALDVESAGPTRDPATDAEEVESLFVVAASLTRSLALEHASIGLAAAGYHHAESRFAFLPVSESPGQAERILDLLARLSAEPSAPFERLLGLVLRSIRAGTTVAVLTGRNPSTYLAHLRRLEAAGCPVLVIACGPAGGSDAGAARAAGFAARTVRLDGPWRTAQGLVGGGTAAS